MKCFIVKNEKEYFVVKEDGVNSTIIGQDGKAKKITFDPEAFSEVTEVSPDTIKDLEAIWGRTG